MTKQETELFSKLGSIRSEILRLIHEHPEFKKLLEPAHTQLGLIRNILMDKND